MWVQRSVLGISREFGKSVGWLLNGKTHIEPKKGWREVRHPARDHGTDFAQRKALLLCDIARCTPVTTGLSAGQPCMSGGQERMSAQGHEGEVQGSLLSSPVRAAWAFLEHSSQFLLL